MTLLGRRWRAFRANRRAKYSAAFLVLLTFFSLTAELWSNSRPLVLMRSGRLHFPVFQNVSPAELGVTDSLTVPYRRLPLQPGDWSVWPVNRWDAYAVNKDAPGFPSPPSSENWLGTDDRGRDVLARLLYGFRYSLAFAAAVWLACAAMALLYGGICGYLGGWVDLLGQRATEILSTVPQLLLLILVVSVIEPSLSVLISVSCLFGWIGLSQLVRGEVLRTRSLAHVEAARALGGSRARILLRSVLPQCVVPLITFAPFMLVSNIIGLAGLDFLGLGLPPPTPSWGELLQQGQAYLAWAWWLALFPALTVFLTLLALTLAGEGVREAMEPVAVNAAEPARMKRSLRAPFRPASRAFRTAVARAILLLSFLCFLHPAGAADTMKLESLTQRASDPTVFRTSKFTLNSEGRLHAPKSYGATVELVDASANGIRLAATKAIGNVAFKTGRFSALTLSAGAHRMTDFPPPGESAFPHAGKAARIATAPARAVNDTIALYTVNYFTTSDPSVWDLSVSASHDYAYQEWVSAPPARQRITYDKLWSRFQMVFAPPWRIRASGHRAALSDGNMQTGTDSSLMFEAVNGKHWVLLGAGVFYVGFERGTASYWSPRNHAAYAFRSESKWRWSRDFSTDLNFNLGRGGTVGASPNFEYLLEARLSYKVEPALDLGVSFTRMRTIRPGGWERNDVSLSVSSTL